MSKPVLRLTDVQRFYDEYHRKIIKNPNLYRSTDTTVTIILPSYLLQFAEHASGHSGFGCGARPLGIRRHQVNSNVFLRDVFSSVEALYNFILTSACDAFDHKTGRMLPPSNNKGATQNDKSKSDSMDQMLAKNIIYKVYSVDQLSYLKTRYGVSEFNRVKDNHTLAEFKKFFNIGCP